MERLFDGFNHCRPRRRICIGLVILFIALVNTTNNADQEPITTNLEISQYWKIPGCKELFYINFEKEIIQETPPNFMPVLNRMPYFTGQKIQYPRTLEEKLDLFRYQFQPQEDVVPTTIHVSKTNMLDDSYEIFRHPESMEKLKALEKIIVTDEATGVADEYTFKEWVLELTRTMLHPDHGLFSYCKGRVILMVNEKSQLLNYYEFFGKLFGAAVYQNLFVSAFFSNRFYKLMLGKEIELEDIGKENFDAYQRLKHDKKKETKSPQELKSILELDYVTPVESIMSTIANGFSQLVPVHFLKIFNETELKLVLEGDSNIRDEDYYAWIERKFEWKENITGVDWDNTDYVTKLFWETISEFDNYQIRQLLQFVTGMSRLPVGGFSKLTPKFNIRRDSTKYTVPPEASIRFNTITLYNCDHRKVSEMILKAIENVCLDKGVSNNELYGVLPRGWQRWKRKYSIFDKHYIYVNLETATAQLEDPRLTTSVKLPDLEKQEPYPQNLAKISYPKNLEDKIRLFRLQLHLVLNSYPGSFIIKKKCISDIVEKSYDHIMNVASIKHLHPTFLVSIQDEKNNNNQVQVQEWLSTLFQKVFDPINNFFQYVDSDDHRLQINPHFEDLNYFKFIGRLFGLSIIHGAPTAAYFTKPFYRLILGKRTSLEDIKDFDLDYYNTLSNLEKDDQGTSLQNNDQKIDMLIREKYLIPILPQMSAILSGLDEFAHLHLFKIFNVDELKEYLGGTPTIDVEDWRENTTYIGFAKDSETVKFFWEIVEKFENDDMERLLQFTTGRLRIRSPGFKDLSPLFQIKLRDGKEISGITFEARFNRITLPEYSNKDGLGCDLRAALAAPLPFDKC